MSGDSGEHGSGSAGSGHAGSGVAGKAQAGPRRLIDALRAARIDEAERTGVVVDLRDAEAARLQILNDALDPLFAQIPDTIDLFERGISQGDIPRLWLDMTAHVMMGRDKRAYRLVQDTRFGRKQLAESHDIATMVDHITTYVARRMIEREKAIAGQEISAEQAGVREMVPNAVQAGGAQGKDFSSGASQGAKAQGEALTRAPRRGSGIGTFILGVIVGAAALFIIALVSVQVGY